MNEETLTHFILNLGINKKIVEFKIGKQICDSCFNTTIDKNFVNKIIDKYKNYEKKKMNNTIYYYHNKQLVVLGDSHQKCYEDEINMDKIDITTSNMDMRILTKKRDRIDINNFPCKKNYDTICQKEIVSVSLENNININISNTQNIHEISIQYIHNPDKKEKIQIIETLLSVIQDMEVL